MLMNQMIKETLLIWSLVTKWKSAFVKAETFATALQFLSRQGSKARFVNPTIHANALQSYT
jgi:hypothetical protein